jgi:hypothetical protein
VSKPVFSCSVQVGWIRVHLLGVTGQHRFVFTLCGKARRKVLRLAIVGGYSLCAETWSRPRNGKKVHAYMASGPLPWCSLLCWVLQRQKLWLGVRLGASGGGLILLCISDADEMALTDPS